MKKKKLLIIIPIVLILVLIIGGTYAFFSASDTNTSTMVGVAASPNLTVNVELLTNENSVLIPIEESQLGTALTHNPKCVDRNGKEVCDVYKITVTSNSQAALYITGEINLTADNAPNLKWKEIASPTSLKEGEISYGLGTNGLFFNDILPIGGSKVYYIVTYINEVNGIQTDKDRFSGIVTVEGRTYIGS